MSTRSRVGIILDDGKILSIYSHADGYIQGVGAELIKGYNSKELALKLIKKGNTGFVESPIEKCEFYGEKPELSKDYHGFLDLALNCSAEYVYIFDPDDNKWWYAKRSGGQFSRFKNLEADLAENPEYRDDYSDDDLDLEASTKPSDMETLLSTVDPDAEDEDVDEYKPVSPNRIIYVYGDWADEEHEDDEVPESLKRAKEWAINHDLVFNIIPLSENMKQGAQWPGFDILGPYKTIFVWYKKFYANEGEENEKGFRDYLFYDEYDTPQEETDAAYKEELAEQKKGDLEASVKTNKGSLLSKSEYDPEEDMEWTDEDGEDDSEGTEWEEGELESEAGSVVIQAILELIDDQFERLGYSFDEWMEEKKEEGYTNEDEMHDAIERAYTRTIQAIENLSIQD